MYDVRVNLKLVKAFQSCDIVQKNTLARARHMQNILSSRKVRKLNNNLSFYLLS